MLVVACPGQGAQKPGFLESFRELPHFFDTCKALGKAAGIDVIAHGTVSDEDTIKDTAVAQPLLVAAAIATYEELFGGLAGGDQTSAEARAGAEAHTVPAFVAGHSVGEIAAAAIAGIFPADDAMRFVKVRAAGMATASANTPTGMAAVVGGLPEDVTAAIAAAGLEPANVNGGGQTVAAGSLESIDKLVAAPPERARVIPLKMAGAFHTHYMESAQAALKELAAELTVADPVIPILTNRDGTRQDSGSAYVDTLISQVTSPVRWDLCQETLVAAGVTGLLELTPGGTLTGLAKRAMKGVDTCAVKSAEDLDAAREFIRAHA